METMVCRTHEMKDGEMREVEIAGAPVLVARVNGHFHAMNGRCTHYGAPLVDGMLSDGRVICPWHHACFDARTGDMIEPPALDSLHCFAVRVDGDEVFVDVPDDAPDRRGHVVGSMVRPEPGPTVAIVGGGAAALMAAQTLRECDDPGRIIMITQENRAPYDRPNLSKDYLAGSADPAWMPLRDDEFYDAHRIELIRGATVSHLDAASKTITLAEGGTITYDRALVATGCMPRRLDVPGADLEGVHLLRSFDDCDAIIASLGGGGRAVIVGASFIGMEVAASLVARGIAVTVVAPDEVPFAKTLGPEIGRRLRWLHESKGVSFQLGAGVASILGTDRVASVELEGGERLEADAVIVGIGVAPATSFITGVELDEHGAVPVDERMCVRGDLYAAGDIAAWPDPRTGERVRVEHWRTAMQLGRVAGFNLAGREKRFDDVPFFWTRQFDATLHYVGNARTWDEIVYRGDVESGDFIAYYVRDGHVHAAAGMGREKELIAISEAMRTRGLPRLDAMPH